jgi:phage tail-like protein
MGEDILNSLGLGSQQGAQKSADVTEYPPVAFHFEVAFTFEPKGSSPVKVRCQEVSGLSKEMTTEELIEGGENRFVYRFPKGTKYNNLVLRRGMKVESKVIDWIRDAIDNFDFSPANVTVNLLNTEHEPLVTWEFQRCWPVKWTTSDLKAQDNAIVIETLELNYDFYSQKKA